MYLGILVGTRHGMCAENMDLWPCINLHPYSAQCSVLYDADKGCKAEMFVKI